jgi:hypothetical protein
MFKKADMAGIKTYSIKKRNSKVNIKQFAKVSKKGVSFRKFLDGIPDVLKAKDIKNIVKAIGNAYKKGKPVIIMMGAHVIKCGLSPLIIDLMERRIVKAVLFNGAGSIHDFEIAYNGSTSEDVDLALADGSFGMSEETGRLMNEALKEGVLEGLGYGESVGKMIVKMKLPNKDLSILGRGYELKVPVLVSSAIGTDIIHQHPSMSGKVLGEASYIDFKIFAEQVSKIGNGGVVLNIGSAVILPEVFLKALSIARNLGADVKNFTTANFDMIQHYRPSVNVLKRPVMCGGASYAVTGHHEIMLPLLHAAVIECI